MAKTLVILGADFSTNKLDTVVFNDPVPCTAITLDKNSIDFESAGATSTIMATVIPNDTTDAIHWESSNPSVATVTNGIVTAVGLGEATITATCGEHSATCSVSVDVIFSVDGFYPGAYMNGTSVSDGGNGLVEISDASQTSSGYAIFGDSTGTKRLYGTFGGNHVYPVKMPGGTKRLEVTRDDSTISYYSIRFFSTEESPTGYNNQALYIARVLTSVVPFTDNVSIIPVPEVAGHNIDSFVIGFSKTNEFTAADFAKITIKALPEAES